MKKKHTLLFLTGAAVGAVLFFSSKTWLPLIHSEGLSFEEGTMLFTGDIMLGRTVERIMDNNGADYPFLGTKELVLSADIAIGNFEGTVPRVHVPTPNFTFAFSIKEAYMEALRDAGFDVLSLANNHALDHGEEAYDHTREVCAGIDLSCFGHPTGVENASAVFRVGSMRVGLLGLHTLFGALSEVEIDRALTELTSTTDIQIAYVHWGDEYMPLHNAAQEALAHALIDGGADAVIGHHPHVVQDIEIYKEKPIFYSLGNFIFDQYFSDEVQSGLVVKLDIDDEYARYELIPITSIGTKSQPRVVEGEAGEKTIATLFARSSSVLPYIKGNTIRIER